MTLTAPVPTAAKKKSIPPLTIPRLFLPNARINDQTLIGLTVGWLFFTLLFWQFVIPHASQLVPRPSEVLRAGITQWNDGVVPQLISSTLVSLTAIFFASIIGLTVSYLSVIPFFKPVAVAIGSLRVLSLTGITIVFVLATPNGYWLKVATLTFSIVVFLVNSMLQVIEDIPRSRFDYARTQGFSQWKVTREVVIRGTLASAFDSVRMNAAMAWMMLTMVEGLSRSGGGVGIVLLELARQANYAAIFAVQVMIYLVGLGQDRLISFSKHLVCPYTIPAKVVR